MIITEGDGMNKLFKLSLGLALLAAIGAGAADDPLQKSNAYTLELDGEMQPGRNFFPLSILRNDEMDLLPRLGYTFTDGGGHQCLEFRTGKECTYHKKVSDRAPVFVSLWAAHTVAGSRWTRNYGTLKNSQGPDGKPHKMHNLNLHDPNTGKYILDCERFSVEKVLEVNGDRVFMWHLDNEWELPMDYSPEAKAGFVKYAKKLYNNDLDEFNRVWGSDYRRFEDFEAPVAEEASKRPGAWLDWRRFQEESYTDFMAARFKNVSEADKGRRRVVFKGTQCTLEMPAVYKLRLNNHEMLADKTREYSKGWYGIDMYGNTDRNCYEYNYFYNCILNPADPEDRRWNWGVFAAETNNHTGPDWQFAESFWRVLGNGVKGFDFFTLGKKGAKGDWATFGFTRASDGVRRGKLYYAARLGAMIHRTEQFWAQSRPYTQGAVAMLIPTRDVLLSEPAGASRWDYSQNNRLNVYTHLREAGYRVDVLPYNKLNDAYLKKYAALVLVGADHLTAAEAGAIERFVAAGGVLLADGQCGFFDDRHREIRSLEKLLGIRMGKVYKGIDVSPDDLWICDGKGNVLRCDGKITGSVTTAELLNADDVANSLKVPMLTRNRFGRGTAFWINTRLGCMRAEGPAHLVGDWLRELLGSAGVEPQAVTVPALPELRIEAPMVDDDGNAAVVFANTVREPLPGFTAKLRMPGDGYKAFYWADAEGTNFRVFDKVKQLKDDFYEFELPSLRTAGVLYAWKKPLPMLGLTVEAVGKAGHAPYDPWTLLVEKGSELTVTVRVADAPAGSKVCLRAFGDWAVTPEEQEVPAGKAVSDLTFRVRLPKESPLYLPEYPCPLLAELRNADGKRIGVCNAVVTVK